MHVCICVICMFVCQVYVYSICGQMCSACIICVHVCMCVIWGVCMHAHACTYEFYVCLCFRCLCIVYIHKHEWCVYNVCTCMCVMYVMICGMCMCVCDMCGVCVLAHDTWFVVFQGKRHKGKSS